MDTLMQSEAGILMNRFKEFVNDACRECRHIKYCRGGCPYNAMAPTPGEIHGVDPHCVAYKKIFDEINDRLNKAMYESPIIEMTPFSQKSKNVVKPGIMTLMRKVVSR
jgi:uncharacterized protein